MSIRDIQGVYLADTARVLGEVTIGQGANIWYGVSIRGDVAPVVIGDNTNVQDNVVIHCDAGIPNVIGSNVTIGHSAVIHGKAIGDGTLIGMGATILGQSVIGRNCLVAAGAVVPPGLQVPDGMVVMGVPGRILRPTTDKEKAYLQHLPPHYVNLAKQHIAKQSEPRFRPWNGNG